MTAGVHHGAEFLKSDAGYPIRSAAVGALESGVASTANGLNSFATILHYYGEADAMQYATDYLPKEVDGGKLDDWTKLNFFAHLNGDQYMPAEYRDKFHDMVNQLYNVKLYTDYAKELRLEERIQEWIDKYVKIHEETRERISYDKFHEGYNIHVGRLTQELNGKIERDNDKLKLHGEYDHIFYPLLRDIEIRQRNAIKNFKGYASRRLDSFDSNLPRLNIRITYK